MSTTSYITFPVETDAATLATEMIQMLMTLQPGWEPNESNLEVALIEVVGTMTSELEYVASLVPAEVFRYAGKSLFNIPAIDGAPATTTSTWTMRDTAGYKIPANTLVLFQPTGSSALYFRTQSDVVVPPGSSTTATGEVTLVATEYGTAYNGIPAGPVTLVDSLIFVSSVVSDDDTSGGVDAETDDAYLNRLRTELKLLSPRPILPADFAALALNVAGVARSTAIDGYNPADGTMNNERMVAVAVADTVGHPLSPTIKSAVDAYLQSLREVNFVVNVIDPTITTVNVTATIKVLPTFDSDTVVAAVESALQDYLTPSTWSWAAVLRYNELIALISDVPGVDYVDTLSQPSGNVTLPGAAALVAAGTLDITAI